MSYVFYYPTKASPTDTVTLRNPERDNIDRRIKVQASGRSMGGTLYCYDKGVDRIEVDLDFTELDETDKTDLQSFFDDSADGMNIAFQVDDLHGTLWDARFLMSELEWVEIGAKTLPVTDPVYSVSIKLELTVP